MHTIVEEQIAQSIVEEDVDAVTRGALFLDEELPGWHHDIDLTSFYISQGACCIVGQLERSGRIPMTWFAQMTGHHYDESLGFSEEVDPEYGIVAGYDELQERWIEEIQKRRSDARSTWHQR